MDRYQWTVLFAAWLGWGFDVFDGLLFNFVAPNCVPTLLGIPLGTPEAKAETLKWAGYLTSVLLIGWAVGGVLFGRVADKIGRTKTLLLTMAMYSLGTALCAFAPNIWVLALCRVIASLASAVSGPPEPRWSRRSCPRSAAWRRARCSIRRRRWACFWPLS